MVLTENLGGFFNVASIIHRKDIQCRNIEFIGNIKRYVNVPRKFRIILSIFKF